MPGGVAVIGGSIAGCAAALAASRGGAEKVTVFERAAGELRVRGTGIGMHKDRFTELAAAGYVDEDMPWAPMNRRLWTVADGSHRGGRAIAVQPFPFRAYAWGTLWSALRERVPAGTDYRPDAVVRGVEQDADGVTVRLGDGGSERFDAVIGADGYRSVVREAMFDDVKPHYAGYVGWRGTSPDTGPCPEFQQDDCHVAVFPGGHCMLYRITVPGGGTRLNWVLYTVPPEVPGFSGDLTSATSLPPGRLSADLTTALRTLVSTHMPPYWAEQILAAPPETTFIQPIYDLEVPRYASGRLLLAGDAATIARPHTGGGSVKALQDAYALEQAWRAGGSWAEITAAYDEGRTALGAQLVALGRRLGHAQVEHTPDWAAMQEADLDAWWAAQNGGSAAGSGFGGTALRRG
ncbi:FAD-dependent monooxygenase [Streptomyces physcomitrii]|uniref:FAD-dependent monooxygenase n=1 Tax=Streptomyces physcomitrii TaxID=2724184 RepID=UPI0033ED40B0